VPLLRRVGELLASPRARVLVPLVGVILTLPSLAGGLLLDDLLHRAKARGLFGHDLWSRLDLFTFIPGDRARQVPLRESGFLPWFAAPDLKLAFLRPVCALLHLFDYTVLDGAPWAMHAESVALYAVSIALAAALYRRLLPPAVAILAALLFAIDDAHGLPVAWLANRNALIGTSFGLLAVMAHHRWRREGWKPGAWLGPLAFGTALLSAELGLGTLAYLVAYAVALDPSPRAKRAWALAPYFAVVIAWQMVYRRLGYGAHATGLYIDPGADIVEFLRAAPGHAAALFIGQLALPPADVYGFAPGWAQALTVVAAIVLAALTGWVLTPRLRADPVTRFLALGMLLSIAPVLASFPSDRTLFFAGVGGSGLVAQVIGDLREPAIAGTTARARCERGLRWFWIAVHLVVAPLVLPSQCAALGVAARSAARTAATFPLDPDVAEKTLILVNTPTVLYAEPLLASLDPARPSPKRLRGLAATTGHVAITREAARTLDVALQPDAVPDLAATIFCDPTHPLRVGDELDAPGLHVTVLGLSDRNLPVHTRYRFDRDLDDTSYLWVGYDGTAFYQAKAPRIGERVVFGSK